MKSVLSSGMIWRPDEEVKVPVPRPVPAKPPWPIE